MTRYTITMVLTIIACFFIPFTANANVNMPLQVPVPNTVTMVDLGSSMCTPCQRMMPTLSELQMLYLGRAAIVYIDVDEYDGMDKQFGASTVPTQIFYDQSGKEVYRHEGYFSRDSIISVFNQIGVPPYAPQTMQPAYPYNMTQQGYQGYQGYYGYQQPTQNMAQQYAAGPVVSPTGLLRPGVINLLYFEANGQNAQINMANVFSPLQQQYGGQVAVTPIDTGMNQALAGNLGVNATPMLIIYGPQGQEIMRYPGAPSLPEMQNLMTRILGY